MKISTAISLFLNLAFLNINAQENQNTELSKLSSGNFTVYKAVENKSSFKFETAAKPWPISFKKTEMDTRKLL